MEFIVEVSTQTVPFARRVSLFNLLTENDPERVKMEARQWARRQVRPEADPPPWLRVWDEHDAVLLDEPVAGA